MLNINHEHTAKKEDVYNAFQHSPSGSKTLQQTEIWNQFIISKKDITQNHSNLVKEEYDSTQLPNDIIDINFPKNILTNEIFLNNLEEHHTLSKKTSSAISSDVININEIFTHDSNLTEQLNSETCLGSIYSETKEKFITNHSNIRILPQADGLNDSEIIEEMHAKYKDIINLRNFRSINKNGTCDICKDKKIYLNDSIGICALCYSATHQSCYGLELLEKIPDSKWFCMRCNHLLKYNLSADSFWCFLCTKDNNKGLLRKVGENKWAHYECINWIPEIFFEDFKKEKINIDSLNNNRFNKICSICRSREGCCIKCDEKFCSINFHVRCASRENLIKSWDIMAKYKNVK